MSIGKFPRGYAYSIETPVAAPGFVAAEIPRGFLSVAPECGYGIAGDFEAFVAIIGVCVDTLDPSKTEAAIAAGLLKRVRAGEIFQLPQHTDHLLGRYVILAHHGGRFVVFGDACATRSIYYAEDAPIVASHSTIIGNALGRPPRKALYGNFQFGLPGNLSAVAGVRLLPANFLIDLAVRQPQRFWPIVARVERPVEEVAPEVGDILLKSAEAICRRWTPAISLTAGIDSRVTLAAFRECRRALTFTYDRGTRDAVDVKVARSLSRKLGLRHLTLEIVPRDESSEHLYRTVEEIVDHKHDAKLPVMYFRHFSGQGFIHVRSNCLEIGRAFWRKHRSMPKEMLPESWSVVSLRKDANGTVRSNAEALQLIETKRFLDMAGYDREDAVNPTLLGYDAWDLVYWEHRMSTWHAQVLLGSDIAFDTVVLFNTRRFLEKILSVPLSDRLGGTLFRRFLDQHAPGLASVAINPKRRSLRSSIGSFMRRCAPRLFAR